MKGGINFNNIFYFIYYIWKIIILICNQITISEILILLFFWVSDIECTIYIYNTSYLGLDTLHILCDCFQLMTTTLSTAKFWNYTQQNLIW